jgi:hypothetical protein
MVSSDRRLNITAGGQRRLAQGNSTRARGFGPSLNLFLNCFDFHEGFDATVGWRTDHAGRVMLPFEKVCFGTAAFGIATLVGALAMLAAL